MITIQGKDGDLNGVIPLAVEPSTRAPDSRSVEPIYSTVVRSRGVMADRYDSEWMTRWSESGV